MLTASPSTLVARIAAQPTEPTREPDTPPGRVWWFCLVLLAPVIATAIVVVVALLVVPR